MKDLLEIGAYSFVRKVKVSQPMDYPAEIFDQVLLLFNHTGFNDHQLHCVLKFESGLDAEVLRKAVISSIEAIPILGTRYVDKGRRPRWESLDRARLGDAFTIARTEAEFDEFVTSRFAENTGPQVKVCLLGSGHSAVALTMNHMVSDAAGFKQYLYFLCEIYTGIMADAGYRPVMVAGDRSIRGVLERFGMGIKLKSLLSQSKENNRSGDHRFPLSEGGDVRPFILTRKLGRENLEAIEGYCRAWGATLNDGVLTAYYRCMCRRLALPSGAELRIPVMVDMRRYLEMPAGFASPDQSLVDGNHAPGVQARRGFRGHARKSQGGNGREEGRRNRPQRIPQARSAI